MFEHHRARPDLADRIGDVLAVDIGRAAVHRFETRGEFALGIQVAGRRDADRTGAGRAEIGEDVAEQVGTHDHVEPVGVLDEMGGEDVDVVLRRFDIRIVRRHFLEALVPVRHRDGNAVGLGRRSHVFACPRRRQFEGVFQNPVDATAGEDGLLHAHFVLGPAVKPSADRRILTLVIFAHHPEVDVARLAPHQRRRHARHQSHRPHIGVELELAADRDQQSPQRDVIGNGRESDGAKVDGVVMADFREAVIRHHLAVRGVVIAAPGFFVKLECDVEFPAGGFEDAHALGKHFLADAVAGNDCDFVRVHATSIIGNFSKPQISVVPAQAGI